MKHLYDLQMPKNYRPHFRVCLLISILFQCSSGEFSTQSTSAGKMLPPINKQENYFRCIRFIQDEVKVQQPRGKKLHGVICRPNSQKTLSLVQILTTYYCRKQIIQRHFRWTKYEYGAVMEYWHGKRDTLWEKSVPLPPCQLKILYELDFLYWKLTNMLFSKILSFLMLKHLIYSIQATGNVDCDTKSWLI